MKASRHIPGRDGVFPVPVPRRWPLALVLLACTLAGCTLAGCTSPLRITSLDPVAAYSRATRTALSGDRVSEGSLTALRRNDLLDLYNSDPDAAIAALHRRVTADPRAWPDLFALGDLSLLRARQTGSAGRYLAAAIYAYAFLFPGAAALPGTAPGPFDPRFRQACDIYDLALSAALTGPDGTLQLRPGEVALPFGTLTATVDPAGLEWGGRPVGSILPTILLETQGVQNQFRNAGLGAPGAGAVAATVAPDPAGLEVSSSLRVPTNILLRLADPRAQLARGTIHGSLELHTIDTGPSIRIDGREVPLEYHQTTARAISLAAGNPVARELVRFFDGTPGEDQRARLIAIAPHRTGRVPVVLIHGTASSPFRWADMVNDLLEDARIRDRYEFWFFTYPSGSPIPQSALQLRQALTSAVDQLGGTAADPALGRVVLIGHSQGGLLAKLLVVRSGDRLWDAISRRPLDRMQLSPSSRSVLQQALFVTPMPDVRKVVFIATPHRGSYLAHYSAAQLLARFVTLPLTVSRIAAEVVTDNADALRYSANGRLRLGSIYGMNPDSPLLLALAALPIVPEVTAHSIIPVLGRGPVQDADDGVVSYRSAHLDGLSSERVLPSGHSAQSNPATIDEVRRILLAPGP